MTGCRQDLSLLLLAIPPPTLPPRSPLCRYLKVVDRVEHQAVSAYVTPGGYRFMLLHEGTRANEEGIRVFFSDVHELLLKVLLNPFYTPHTRIEAREFDARVKALARRHVGYKGGE